MGMEVDGIMQYSISEVKDILEKGTHTVIDVRTEEEYESGHIPNVPFYPMQEVMEWAEKLDPSKPYVFVCRSGNRSQRVAQYLKQAGFENVANYRGGMLTWDGDLKSGMTP